MIVARFLLAALFASSLANTSTAKTLTLAAWNIEHFAEDGTRGCKPRTADDIETIRSYIEALDADVIALQEIENMAAARKIFDAGDYDIHLSGQPEPAAFLACPERPTETYAMLRTGFAIRKGISYTVNGDVDALGLYGDPNRDTRWGLDITVNEGRPVRLLAVHLESNCFASRDESEPCRELFDQLPRLKNWIDDRLSDGQPFAVLGDFNRRLNEEGDVFWATLSDSGGGPKKLHAATADQTSSCLPPWTAFIDHIVMGPKTWEWKVRDSFRELTFSASETGDRRPSDHCPISIAIEVPEN